MNNNERYNGSMAGKGAFLDETKIVLNEIARGKSNEQVRKDVIKNDLLDQKTLASRKKYWAEINRRYLSERSDDEVDNLTRVVLHCKNQDAVDLILFYEYCQEDKLLHDLTVDCTFNLYHQAKTTIDKIDINHWLKQKEEDHPEISNWTQSTHSRIVRSYLATIRDFGLVKGVMKKEFYKFYTPREAFVYALYRLRDQGLKGKQLIKSEDWRLFLMDEREVIFMLDDAAKAGYVHFRHSGDIYDLRFIYDDLGEVVNDITG